MPPPVVPGRVATAVSDFKAAVQQLGLPVCPHCGELRQVERLNSRVWRCEVCSKPFHVEPQP